MDNRSTICEDRNKSDLRNYVFFNISLLTDLDCGVESLNESGAGCIADILVHALDDAAKRFYEINGFEAIPEQPLTLFLSVATATTAIQSEQ
jgi:hypothetical protein